MNEIMKRVSKPVFIGLVEFITIANLSFLPLSAFAGNPLPPRPTQKTVTTKIPHNSLSKRLRNFWLKAQKALISKGYKIKADGIVGPQTRQAIFDFQKTHKLKPTGRINKATLDILMPCPPHC